MIWAEGPDCVRDLNCMFEELKAREYSWNIVTEGLE